MDLTEYETKSLRAIRSWEIAKRAGAQTKVLDAISKPFDLILRSVDKKTLRTLERALAKTINLLLHASTFAVRPQTILKRAREHGVRLKDISDLPRCDLETLDQCNRKNIDFHRLAGTIQGAVAGLGGAAFAMADISSLLVQDFHMIQEIVYCYGFDPSNRAEKEIILRIIMIAIGGSEMKRKMLSEIDTIHQIEYDLGGLGSAPGAVSVVGARAMQEYTEHLAVRLLAVLSERVLPLLSSLVGAHSNREIIVNSGEAAFMVYRKRFILRKKYMD